MEKGKSLGCNNSVAKPRGTSWLKIPMRHIAGPSSILDGSLSSLWAGGLALLVMQENKSQLVPPIP